ncbi:AlpA family transcriptional regulator [Granulicella sp. dw_53]|uniref:helix-turn-helix transcriptional regulator n=1 Tax=Granulicella sp. dw_53 TaxID=2719792 RepID=UPI001BD1C5CA|nr:AlpA family transcriptional regulator [Granulicella sp. dw_53]
MSAIPENLTSFLRLPQVKQRTGLSRSSIYAKISLGEFPAPVNLGARAVAWIDAEVQEWISDRVKASRISSSADGVTR